MGVPALEVGYTSATTGGVRGFHAYINEMHGLRSKIPKKKSRQAAMREEI
jgi:hypothetical protein